MPNDLIRINRKDNVAVLLRDAERGETLSYEDFSVTLLEDIGRGHKVAISDIGRNSEVMKYGWPIGCATEDIPRGGHVHTHNTKTLLSNGLTYSYDREAARKSVEETEKFAEGRKWPEIRAYLRKDGRIGIRNELWIVPTVGCVNGIAKTLEEWGSRTLGLEDGVHAWTHPFGCSQLGDDHEATRKILAGLVHHPNAGGVLVLGLGCENNTMDSFRELLGPVDGERVKFLVAQESVDEMEDAKKLMTELSLSMHQDVRTPQSIDKLVIGFKCGGSDGLSGITANPLVGNVCNEIVAAGGSAILTEVPEMFGAEQILMNRAVSEKVFDGIVEMIDSFKDYFVSHGQVVYENPSPGNKKGGITTLEDKSLGCIQKGGFVPVSGVLPYGGRVSEKGLNLLSGPGNDIVSTTAQAAAGAHIILFTTGRGTPLGSPVPTVKISTNTELSEHKRNWIDFDAGQLLSRPQDEVTEELLSLITAIADGRTRTKNEKNGYREISLFKDGVIL